MNNRTFRRRIRESLNPPVTDLARHRIKDNKNTPVEELLENLENKLFFAKYFKEENV